MEMSVLQGTSNSCVYLTNGYIVTVTYMLISTKEFTVNKLSMKPVVQLLTPQHHQLPNMINYFVLHVENNSLYIYTSA